MIYIKIGSRVYKENEVNKMLDDFGLDSMYKHNKALIRVIKNLLNNELKGYPEIDIVINHKNIHTSLGRLCLNNIKGHREYKFIKQNTGNPYIVLFWHCIEYCYTWHSIKGLKSVLIHEFSHFKDWLLNKHLGHGKGLKHRATGNAVNDLQESLTYLRG